MTADETAEVSDRELAEASRVLLTEVRPIKAGDHVLILVLGVGTPTGAFRRMAAIASARSGLRVLTPYCRQPAGRAGPRKS